jgi:hypothetical protein
MTPYSIVSPQAVAVANWNQMHGITTTSDEVRPMEGDLIYLPITNDVFEISQSEHESVFYQVGYRYIWRISVNKFKYSHEKIQTGIPKIDAVESLFENVDSVDNDPLADNNTFLDRADTTNINKTEKNIFGDVI